MNQQPAFEYLGHGLTPFFRLANDDGIRRADAVILGVPYDGGVTYQPGARMGPYHVRRTSALLQSFHSVHNIDVFGTVSAYDGGNIAVPPFDAAMSRELIMARVASLIDRGAVPFLLGGDHSISLPALRAVHAAHGPIALVHIDAHLDTSTAATWNEPFHHGTPIRHAITEGLVAQGQLFQLGIRVTRSDEHEDDLVREFGGELWSVEHACARGISDVMAEIRQSVGKQPVYLTFDIDGVDPAFAPGTGTPVPGGFSSRESLQIVRGLAGCKLVGMDLVEVAPCLDHADMTCHLAAHLLYEGLAVLAVSKTGRTTL